MGNQRILQVIPRSDSKNQQLTLKPHRPLNLDILRPARLVLGILPGCNDIAVQLRSSALSHGRTWLMAARGIVVGGQLRQLVRWP